MPENKKTISLEAGVLIQEITKRPKMESRFPKLFKTTNSLNLANLCISKAEKTLKESRQIYLAAKDYMKMAEEQIESAILAQADAFMEEVVKK